MVVTKEAQEEEDARLKESEQEARIAMTGYKPKDSDCETGFNTAFENALNAVDSVAELNDMLNGVAAVIVTGLSIIRAYLEWLWQHS